MWRSAPFVAVVVLASSPLAQSAPDVAPVLDRLGAYLIEYETQLSTIVADEHFEQEVHTARSRQSVVLESEVAFTRLPGNKEWLGFREVKRKNSQPISGGRQSMTDLLASPAGESARAVMIARASAQHNLGLARTINTPTTPLDIVHPRHRAAHRFELRGDARLRGRKVVVVAFEETSRPTLLREPSGIDLISSGRIWIDPAAGTVWRIHWIYERHLGSYRPPSLRVDFEPQAALGLMVPRQMIERFHTERGVGQGTATYKNFRRFGTSARIVPQ